MMTCKARLEFDLSDPDACRDHQVALDGWNYKLAWQEMFAKLRNQIKYESKESWNSEEVYSLMNDSLDNWDVQDRVHAD